MTIGHVGVACVLLVAAIFYPLIRAFDAWGRWRFRVRAERRWAA